MKLETYRRAQSISLGDLTEPCEGCKQQTKLADFVWVERVLAVICRKCASKYETRGNPTKAEP